MLQIALQMSVLQIIIKNRKADFTVWEIYFSNRNIGKIYFPHRESKLNEPCSFLFCVIFSWTIFVAVLHDPVLSLFCRGGPYSQTQLLVFSEYSRSSLIFNCVRRLTFRLLFSCQAGISKHSYII